MMKTLTLVLTVAVTLAAANVPLGKMERMKMMQSVVHSQQTQNAANQIECSMCQMLYNFVASMANEEEPVIQQKVDALCGDLGPLGGLCKTLVDSYLPTLIKGLQDGKDQTEVCGNLLHLCSGAALFVPKVVPKVQAKPAKPIVAANQIECSLCQMLYNLVASMANQEEPEIQQQVDALCQSLGPLAATCKSLVDSYLQQIISGLQSGKDQTEVCNTLLHLCASKVTKPVVRVDVPKVQVSGGIGCTICGVLYEVIAGMANQDEPAIQAACDSACDALGFLSSTCKSLVDQYLPQMVQAIQSGKDQQEVCGTLLGLCVSPPPPAHKFILSDKERTEALKAAFKALPISRFNFITCEVCKLAVKELEKAVANHDQTILNDLTKVCDILPGSFKSECVSLVTKYGGELLKDIMDGAGDQACSLVGLC